MKPLLTLCWVILFAPALVCFGSGSPNLAEDASFESPVSAWFQEPGHGSYFAGKKLVADAADGQSVLDIQGWDQTGSKILSPVMDLTTNVYSGTIHVRSFGTNEGATMALGLFDEKGTHELASFGTATVDGNGQWRVVQGVGVKLATPPTRGRLAILVKGPQLGARIEVDQVGLFAGDRLGTVADNADFASFEAEDLADGKAWKVADHYTGWYAGLPSGLKMLSGAGAVTAADNRPAQHTVEVHVAGPHRLWTRLMRVALANHGTYRIAIQQNGREIAAREIDDGDEKLGPVYSWIWVPLDADLATGTAQVVLSRPASGSSWVARKIDLFVLTNLLDYQPAIQDFRPKGFLRWTNRSASPEPFCLWFFIRRNQPPAWHATPGMLSAAGFSGSYYVPSDQSKWIAPGQSTPWVNLSRYLLPGGGRNSVQIVATRNMHTDGFVTNEWRGTLEFAVGDEHRVVRTVEIDQSAPRVLMTLPYDFEHQADQIYTPFDYLQKKEQVLSQIGKPRGRVAVNLDLNVILAFDTKMDDPRVIEKEIQIIKQLGFNGTYTPITQPADAEQFYVRRGLPQHFGMWVNGFALMKNNCFDLPDVERMDSVFQGAAKQFEPILGKVERMKLADEPGGPSYEAIVTNQFYREAFTRELKTQGLTPQDLGVTAWDQVVPVLPADRDRHPELFYYTGLFRLQSFARLARASVAEKQKYLPANVKTYVNYSPPVGVGTSWDQRGTDLFLAQRHDGLEMGWTEDWLGWGASPQQIAPAYALLRCAGAPTDEPLGGYDVVVSGGPLLQQIKFYELLAAGARHINFYNYGPYYASIDSWSTAYNVYPVLSRVLHEAGVIDGALKGTTRHPTDVAILYNRTAGIWAYRTSTSEHDSYLIHWALAHAGYDADFIPEEDIEGGKLDRYKVLYVDGPQLRRVTAEKIAAWVKRGGVLFGAAGAGSRDEFDRPCEILDAVFGARSRDLKLEHNVGRAKYELRTQPVLDVLTSVDGSGAPTISLNQLCYRETLVPEAGATVILKDQKGAAAGVLNHDGQGVAIRVAAEPGITYLADAVRDKDYDPESYLAKKFRPALRDFLAWPARLAQAFRIAQATSTPIPEIVRYDGRSSSVIFIIDHQATPVAKFELTLFDAGQFRRAYAASGKPVHLRRLNNGTLQVSLPLNVTDAVVLEKTSSAWQRFLDLFR